jgi:hypothetical protein
MTIHALCFLYPSKICKRLFAYERRSRIEIKPLFLGRERNVAKLVFDRLIPRVFFVRVFFGVCAVSVERVCERSERRWK